MPHRKGEKGERGERGFQGESTILSRKITVSFIIVVVVSFVALAALGYVVGQNRKAIRHSCESINEVRAINNRDRLTLLKGARDARANAAIVKDPTLKRLLLDSATNTDAEVAIRPYLDKLDECSSPVPFPPKHLQKRPPKG